MGLPSTIFCFILLCSYYSFYPAHLIFHLYIFYVPPSNCKLDEVRDCISFLHCYVHYVPKSILYMTSDQ